MRALSIAACFALACFSVGCAEEDARVGSTADAGADAGARPDAGAQSDAGSTMDGGTMNGGNGMDAAVSAMLPVNSSGPWTIFDAGEENPAENIEGSARAESLGDGGMRIRLDVTGLSPNATFGTHLHRLACDNMSGGPHYQHVQAPAGEETDPTYANPMNEVWLDLESDPDGTASQTSEVDWIPRAGGARSIVVHALPTAEGGVAGTRLACMPMPF